MQIELIGCTSAGKSTLARDILQACQKDFGIVLGDDFVLGQIRLQWVKSHLFRKILVNLTALSACVMTWRDNQQVLAFAARLLAHLPTAPFEKLNILRNVLKRAGIYQIVRLCSTDQQVILVDEGVLQIAHYLFVHMSVNVGTDYLSDFARLVPLPDAIVYLRQSEPLLIDRTVKRGHKRIPDRSYRSVSHFIKQAVATFDQLAQYPVIQSRLLVVDGGQNVRIVASDPGEPTMGLASRIIQSGLASGASASATERTPSPGLSTIPSTSSD